MMVISYASFLFAVWLLLSGHLEPLMLGLGLVSVLVTVLLIKRMTLIDHESYPLHLSTRMPTFLTFIMKEIIKANIDVIRRIVTLKSTSISPQLIEVKAPLKTDLGRVIYANSITLTPGTVSVKLGDDKILVHALTKQAADDLATGKMAKSIPDDHV